MPDDYSLSHAVRWALLRKPDVTLGLEEADKIIQRRHSQVSSTRSSRTILNWLSRQTDSSDRLRIEGWTAVANRRSIQRTKNDLERLVRFGLIDINNSGPHFEVKLRDAGEELLKRSIDRRIQALRRRPQQIDASRRSALQHRSLYVSKASIAQFKCFESRQDVSFADESGKISQWTFLIGENGVGKTTVLQLIAGLFPTHQERRSRPTAAFQDTPDISLFDSKTTSDNFSIEVEFHQGDLGKTLQDPAIFGALGQSYSLDRLELQLQLAADSVVMSMTNVLTYAANYDRLPPSPLIVGYGASRAVAKYGLAGDRDRSSRTFSLFNPESPLQDPEDWLLRSDYASRFEHVAQGGRISQFEKLQSTLLQILPDVSEISIRPPSEIYDRPWVGFKTSLGVMDYSSLSVGYQSTIAWVIDLAIRMIENYPESDTPLNEPAIVLIDEIDIHLHPSWQRSITEDLQRIFPAVQFIATTHSPLIIQGAVEVNLVLLRANNDSIEVINDVDEIRNFRVDQILTSELFDLPSARPDRAASLFRRRTEILSSNNPDMNLGELDDIEDELRAIDSLSKEEPLARNAQELIDKLRRKS